MDLAAFLSLEDISNALPPYQEEVVAVGMDPPLKAAYAEFEGEIKEALRSHRGNQSVVSTALNALLLYPDRPFGLGELTGYEYNPETGRRERFRIASRATWRKPSSTPKSAGWSKTLKRALPVTAAFRSTLSLPRRET